MEHWQKQYIENTKQIAALTNFYASSASGFEAWYRERLQAAETVRRLRAENISLLAQHLFPALDELHSAAPEVIRSLEDFADELMDWRTNLDCGVYTAIHDALLSVYRIRKDRNAVIRELYKLGMGFYYMRRFLTGIDAPETAGYSFQNEMVFTEAGSYIRYYDEIEDDETRGFIIRAMANVALCTSDRSRRIAASAKTLQITQDPHYREKSPSLPWDSFVRKTHQQMSANRTELSAGSLSREELAAVLDSCYEVFRPEEQAENPSVRWLWPYYEMEYNCGYVTLDVTLRRLEDLITRTPFDRYDMSGLYANVQLPVYYGRLLQEHPGLADENDCIRFLDGAYRKMMKTLLSCPPEHMDDYFFYTIDAAITDYYETPGVPTYREITEQIMRRFCGEDYIRFRRTGDVIRCICDVIWDQEPGFFDDLPYPADPVPGDPAYSDERLLSEGLPLSASAGADASQKKAALLQYARDCGLYFDFGLVKMNISRTMQTRNLFESEYRMYQLHTVSGHQDLLARASTARFADIALGHHRWYDASDGYPDSYERIRSPYRQMTDIVSIADALTASYEGDPEAALQTIQDGSGRQFSPLVTAWLTDETLKARLGQLLDDSFEDCYRDMWEQMPLQKNT